MIEIIARDINSLPNGLLDRVKAHLRIDHCEDDSLVQDMIAAVIEVMEAHDNCSIFQTSYLWTPDATEFAGDLALVPISPVGLWSAAADPGAVDVTADFAIRANAMFGMAQYYVHGVHVPGLAITIASGFTAATLPPAKRLDIGRGVSTVYEYRDILTPSNLAEMPGWMADRVCGNWRPRV